MLKWGSHCFFTLFSSTCLGSRSAPHQVNLSHLLPPNIRFLTQHTTTSNLFTTSLCLQCKRNSPRPQNLLGRHSVLFVNKLITKSVYAVSHAIQQKEAWETFLQLNSKFLQLNSNSKILKNSSQNERLKKKKFLNRCEKKRFSFAFMTFCT